MTPCLELRGFLVPLYASPTLTHAISDWAQAWRTAAGRVVDPEALEGAMRAALEAASALDLLPALIDVWCKLEAVQQAQRTRGLHVIPLLEHTFSISHDSVIEITLDAVPLGRVSVHLELEFGVMSAILTIDSGRIRGVRLGRVIASAAIGFAGRELLREELGELALPLFELDPNPARGYAPQAAVPMGP